MPASQGQRAPVSIAAPGGLAAPCRTCGSSASPWWGGCGPVVITAAQYLHPQVSDSETCRLTFFTKFSTANRVCPRHPHLCQLRARPSGPLGAPRLPAPSTAHTTSPAGEGARLELGSTAPLPLGLSFLWTFGSACPQPCSGQASSFRTPAGYSGLLCVCPGFPPRGALHFEGLALYGREGKTKSSFVADAALKSKQEVI